MDFVFVIELEKNGEINFCDLDNHIKNKSKYINYQLKISINTTLNDPNEEKDQWPKDKEKRERARIYTFFFHKQ